MIRRFFLFILCIVGYAGFLLITFPAIHAWGFLKNKLPPIQASSIEGSIWNAHISNLQIGSFQLKNIDAGLAFLPLLSGKVSINTKITGPGFSSSGLATVNTKKIEITQLKAKLHAGSLSKFAYPGVRLLGKLKLSFDTLRIIGGRLSYIQGTTVWHNAQIHGPLKLNLGKITMTIKTQRNIIKGSFISKGSADKIKGSIAVQANGQYHLTIYFTPARISAEQRSWLLTISKAGPDGSFKFFNKGHLFSASNSRSGRRR